MEFFKQKTRYRFLAHRRRALIVSITLVTISIASLGLRGLNLGIDFSGGTLVEVGYSDPVDIEAVRQALQAGDFPDAIVQHFGSTREVLVRLPVSPPSTPLKEATPTDPTAATAAQLSEQVMAALRSPYSETLTDTDDPTAAQQCTPQLTTESTAPTPCQVQMRRVEFVGPQVGDELTNQGSLAMLYALFGILIYVTFRFEWRFAVGSVIALAHDVLITVGVFSLFQLDFSLPVLAAVLAVIGYSLNDTIVVYDRIRENFRKMRRHSTESIIDNAINQTLPRTVLTSLTTLIVVLTLLIFGGEVIRGFATALLAGVIIGTYSSIFVASPAVMALGITREDMLIIKKEGADPTP